MASANSIQPARPVLAKAADAMFAADKALITNATEAAPDPQITRAERIAEAFAGSRRARAERGGEV